MPLPYDEEKGLKNIYKEYGDEEKSERIFFKNRKNKSEKWEGKRKAMKRRLDADE